MNGKEEMVLLLPIWRDMLVLFEITDWKNIDNFLFLHLFIIIICSNLLDFILFSASSRTSEKVPRRNW